MQCVFCNRSFNNLITLVEHEDEHRKPTKPSGLATLPREIRVKIRNLLIGDLGTLWKLNENALAARFFGKMYVSINVPHGPSYRYRGGWHTGGWYSVGDRYGRDFQSIAKWLNCEIRKKVRVCFDDTHRIVGEEYEYTSGEALLLEIADTLSKSVVV